ncbi:MAG: hypothetical protein IT423_20300 [Pirellulaceae bacterium]|nr:hypothetical protein [Pirellulaceae bacterium]
METALCIVGGVLTMSVAVGLSYLRSPQWHNALWEETAKTRTIAWWGGFQRHIRRCTNLLLGLIGLLVFACAFLPHGRIWMATWLVIFVALMTALFLAGLDALASMVGYRQAVPETARQTLSRYEPHP